MTAQARVVVESACAVSCCLPLSTFSPSRKPERQADRRGMESCLFPLSSFGNDNKEKGRRRENLSENERARPPYTMEDGRELTESLCLSFPFPTRLPNKKMGKENERTCLRLGEAAWTLLTSASKRREAERGKQAECSPFD